MFVTICWQLIACKGCPPPGISPPPPTLLGYAAYREQALTTLHAGKSVHLCGPGGIGKTSLGATILGQLAPAPVFWYTFRPTLNDRIGSLLFSLGHFLHAYKASHLWQLVVAAGGIIEDYQLALALLRQDVALLAPHPPVLCFDEIDRLYSTDAEQASLGYTQLIAFLEGLHGLTPLLLISQKATIETDLYLTPAGLAAPQILALFQQAGCPLEREQAQQLQRYTGGNPRLLVLCLALHQTGEPLIEQLARGTQAPALAVLVHLICVNNYTWRRRKFGWRMGKPPRRLIIIGKATATPKPFKPGIPASPRKFCAAKATQRLPFSRTFHATAWAKRRPKP